MLARTLLTSLAALLACAAIPDDAAHAETIQWHATAAEKDDTYGQYSGGHAIWLPGLKSITGDKKWIFDGDGLFVEVDSETATLTGTIFVEGTDYRFDVSMSFENDGSYSPDPKKELLASAYSDVGGPIDTDDWNYYLLLTELSLTGEGDFDGLNLVLDHAPDDESYGFQVGVGANGKNLLMGMSGWFGWTRHSSSTIHTGLTTGNGDVNINLSPVPEPGTLALLGVGLVGLALRRRRQVAR